VFTMTRLFLESSRKGSTIIYISCNCDLLNLALHDAPGSSCFLQRCNQSIVTWAHRLRQCEHCRVIQKGCPTIHQRRRVMGISFGAFSQGLSIDSGS
jgi:hypothetical protein